MRILRKGQNMRVGQLIDMLAKLSPDLEIGMVKWKPPNYTTWESVPMDVSMVDKDNKRTERPEQAVKVIFHRA